MPFINTQNPALDKNSERMPCKIMFSRKQNIRIDMGFLFMWPYDSLKVFMLAAAEALKRTGAALRLMGKSSLMCIGMVSPAL